MEACEVCKGHDSVMWDLNEGFICLKCHEVKLAIARQKEIDDEIERERMERARVDFFFEP